MLVSGCGSSSGFLTGLGAFKVGWKSLIWANFDTDLWYGEKIEIFGGQFFQKCFFFSHVWKVLWCLFFHFLVQITFTSASVGLWGVPPDFWRVWGPLKWGENLLYGQIFIQICGMEKKLRFLGVNFFKIFFFSCLKSIVMLVFPFSFVSNTIHKC